MLYINLTNKPIPNVAHDYHYLSEYLLDYDVATSGRDLSTSCETYPYDELTASKVRCTVDSVYHKIWSTVYTELNDLNGVDLNTLFWEFYGSYDFYFFICMYFERYVEIKRAIVNHAEVLFYIRRRKTNQYYIAKSNLKENYDDVVSEIDWQIMSFLGINPIVIEDEVRHDKDPGRIVNSRKMVNEIRENVQFKAKALFLNTIMRQWMKEGGISFEVGNLSVRERIDYTKHYHHGVWFPIFKNFKISQTEINEIFRERVLAKIDYRTESEFEDVFFSSLYKNLFTVFVEDFSSIWRKNRKYLTINAQCIIRTYFEPDSMMRAGFVYANGGSVVEYSHAFEDIIEKIPYCKTIELCRYSVYWAKNDLTENHHGIYCSDTRLQMVKSIDYTRNKSIVFVFTDTICKYTRNLYEALVREAGEAYETHILKPKDLYFSLTPSMKDEICFRVRDTWNRNCVSFLRSFVDEEHIEDMYTSGISFLERLATSRIVILDSIDTSCYIEALLAQIPVIVITRMDLDKVLMQPMADICHRMRSLDMIVDNAEQAAMIVNKNYEHIKEWWDMSPRKEVREELLSKIIPTSSDTRHEWIDEIVRLIRNKE